MPNHNLTISKQGIDKLIELEANHLTSYLDIAGIWTIGVGHTGKVDGVEIGEGMRISKLKSMELLKSDLIWCEKAVRNNVTVKLTQNEYDSLVMFVFNIGSSAFRRSTMLRLLNDGVRDEQLYDAWRLWTKITQRSKKVFSRGLLNRRTAEIRYFKESANYEVKEE